MRVLVTGGTGKTGKRVAARLSAAGHEAVIASRSAHHGVVFDWSNPATYADAARNIDAAYLVAPSGAFDLLAAMRPFIDTLIAQGAGRLVLLSAASLDRGGPMMGAVHDYLADYAPRWTALRPSWFMQNFSEQQHRETIVEEDTVYSAAGDGRVGWIDADDIAAVAAAVLVDTHRANADLVLTGPETLSYDALAAMIGAAVGRKITHRRLNVDALVRRFEAAGMPTPYAETLAGMDGAIEAGVGDFVTRSVTEITGQAATSFAQFALQSKAAWQRA
jgi:ergot alkaloid biosynthesis protein